MNTARLIQLSGVIVDLVYRVEQVPAPGHEADVYGFQVHAGGGFNAMLAARRAGMRVGHAGTVGTGPLADKVQQALDAEAIERLLPRHATLDQGCSTVLIDRAGERTFIAAEGADGVASIETLNRIDFGLHDWVLLSGYALHYENSRDALATWLQKKPCIAGLVFDPAPVVERLNSRILEAVMHAATWVSANHIEARALCGEPDPARASLALAATRPENGGAIVRAGADGCYLACHGQAVCHVPGVSVDAIDTNGAGDTHVGSFVAELARGATPADAALYANIAAALSTTCEGPATAPCRESVLAHPAINTGKRYYTP